VEAQKTKEFSALEKMKMIRRVLKPEEKKEYTNMKKSKMYSKNLKSKKLCTLKVLKKNCSWNS
jgi:hypothetical protein